ncbi:MAG: PP2C family protein-serine/threonine phosphatase [bacterium]
MASLCLPAREVGGDYYDFVEIGEKKLGVAIGDVSGKGTSAAFYMTLTKGFFKSQAKYGDSPMQVLINMNELFYDNVERGVFISMIYSVFDLEKKKMTFSRAGHNPMILRRSGKGEAEEISPPGIALGLEKGEIFSRTIEQKSIPIHSGDVFLFYTDGLNEAINASNEEYGETRLRLAVEKNSHLPVEVLLDNIEEDICFFTGRTPQYDDMTAVVIKIK